MSIFKCYTSDDKETEFTIEGGVFEVRNVDSDITMFLNSNDIIEILIDLGYKITPPKGGE